MEGWGREEGGIDLKPLRISNKFTGEKKNESKHGGKQWRQSKQSSK